MFSRRLCCHAEIWVSLVHCCPATEWPFLHAAKKQRQNWSYKGPRLGWKSKKVLYVSTRGQLDIFQVFPYDFVTFLAVVWPGLLGTSCIACFRKVMYPQNQQHYCRSQGKMNKLDSCKKKKKIPSEHRPSLRFPEHRAICDFTGPVPLKPALSLLTSGISYGKHLDNYIERSLSRSHSYNPGKLVNDWFIMGAWWVLTNGLHLTESMLCAWGWRKSLQW